MGNWFSQEDELTKLREEQQRRRQEILLQQQILLQQRQRLYQQQITVQLSSTHQETVSRPSTTEIYSREYNSRIQNSGYNNNNGIVKCIDNHPATISWSPMALNETVKYVNLLPTSSEYIAIARLFTNTNKKYFKVSCIERVQNPYLYGTYLLKKEELFNKYGYVEEKLLFHGTKSRNASNICEENFNWRLHGKGTGHRFGQGVSFSPISNYATHYCDKHLSEKVMFVVKVLISSACVGNANMIIPPAGFDTTQKEDGHVIVKYDDNEFYPAYKLYFTQSY